MCGYVGWVGCVLLVIGVCYCWVIYWWLFVCGVYVIFYNIGCVEFVCLWLFVVLFLVVCV